MRHSIPVPNILDKPQKIEYENASAELKLKFRISNANCSFCVLGKKEDIYIYLLIQFKDVLTGVEMTHLDDTFDKP